MAGQARVEEKVGKQEQNQDCGCGCGGALCGTVHEEVIWVGSQKPVEEAKPGRCDCGCECCS